MTHTPSEVRRFDLFKLIVTLALLVFLIALVALRACQRTPTSLPIPDVDATRSGIEVEEIAEEKATEENVAEVEIVAPTLNLPAAGGELTGGELMLTGTGEPGSEVRVLVDGESVGVAQVGSDGNWSLTAELDEPGEHEIVVQALDAGGEVVAASEPILLTVAAPVAAPTLDSLTEGAELPSGELTLTGTGEPGSEVQILVDGEVVGVVRVDSDGNWSLIAELDEPGEHDIVVQALDAGGEVVAASEPILLTVAAPIAAPTLDFPTEGAELPSGELTLTGTGEPGTEIEILDNGVVVGATQVGEDGQWYFIFEPEAGDHQLVVRPGGDDPAAGSAVRVTVASPAATTACTSPAGACTGDTYVVVAGDTLTCISKCAEVGLWALIAANPQIEDPDLIFPRQVINIPR